MRKIGIIVTILVVLVVVSLGVLALYIDNTSPHTKYVCSGAYLTLRHFDKYTCVDCCYVEVNGFYEFNFPDWVWNDGKIMITTSEIDQYNKNAKAGE